MYENFKKEDNLLGVEVGVWEGDNAKRMMDELPNLTLIGVDPFEGYQDWHMYIDERNISEREQRAIENMKPYVEAGRFSFLRKYSDKALEDLEDEKFDFVYVDADHSYEWAYHDITNYWSKIKSGGVLCGHDRNLSGVSKALAQFCEEKDIPFTPSESPQTESWYIVKP